MKKLAPVIAALSICLGGCGGATGNNAAGNNAVGAGAGATANASGNTATASAEAPAGPCPFEIRNVRAVRSGLPDTPPGAGSGAAIFLSMRPDAEGRQPMISQRISPPPDLLLDIDPDPGASTGGDRGWSETGIGGFPATPDYTHAVVRCRGNQVARVPIQP